MITPDMSGLFDIIIDGGLHTFPANICFFENSILNSCKAVLYY